MTMVPKTNRLILVAALAIGGLLSGCSGDEERAESPKLRQCETLLGAESVRAVVKATGGDDVSVSGTPQADVLADQLVREAKRWQKSDLLHTPYTACRMSAFEGDRIVGTVDVSVKWSVLSVRMMDNPQIGRTWRQVNESLFVAPEPGPARMQLLAVCAVPGAIASQPSDLPLQFEVAGKDLGTELRWELLSTFARSVAGEMDCEKRPVVPSALPTSG
ncbi:hypothetical protein LEL86_05630 [Streptomyces sp. WA6-1-16]|uniref:hypothetical protein n=1 Tax=Streptomyces sp. WA6-1-16 TaxID=2879427 RepID=UPI000A2429BF|nr:hypothetical protein [Streptomyces sp. WA6-1-16]OSC75950.1 hypothetical protein B5180_04710 [Streptomyces sp. BF-3]UCA48789.1 hypothetical protein LEL86_05630 [Streptomyces sp. WA6-1-16]